MLKSQPGNTAGSTVIVKAKKTSSSSKMNKKKHFIHNKKKKNKWKKNHFNIFQSKENIQPKPNTNNGTSTNTNKENAEGSVTTLFGGASFTTSMIDTSSSSETDGGTSNGIGSHHQRFVGKSSNVNNRSNYEPQGIMRRKSFADDFSHIILASKKLGRRRFADELSNTNRSGQRQSRKKITLADDITDVASTDLNSPLGLHQNRVLGDSLSDDASSLLSPSSKSFDSITHNRKDSNLSLSSDKSRRSHRRNTSNSSSTNTQKTFSEKIALPKKKFMRSMSKLRGIFKPTPKPKPYAFERVPSGLYDFNGELMLDSMSVSSPTGAPVEENIGPDRYTSVFQTPTDPNKHGNVETLPNPLHRFPRWFSPSHKRNNVKEPLVFPPTPVFHAAITPKMHGRRPQSRSIVKERERKSPFEQADKYKYGNTLANPINRRPPRRVLSQNIKEFERVQQLSALPKNGSEESDMMSSFAESISILKSESGDGHYHLFQSSGDCGGIEICRNIENVDSRDSYDNDSASSADTHYDCF